MSRTKPRPAPDLVEFVAGYPGPAEMRYHGGSVEVVAALIYKDGVRIDWRMRSMPDLSWLLIDGDEVLPRMSADSSEIPDLIGRRSGLRRVTTFWEQSALFDDRGNELQRFKYSHGMSIKDGWQGEIAFFSSVQLEDGQDLTLRVGDLVIVIH
jgi:hypothetical protein